MKVTSVSFSDLEYRLIKWYAMKCGTNVSRLAAKLILSEAELWASQNGCRAEWAVLFEDKKPEPVASLVGDVGVVVDD